MATLARKLIARQSELLTLEATSPTRGFVPSVLPGVMQTPAYAASIFEALGFDAHERDAAVSVRMQRAEQMGRATGIPVTYIITEHALHKSRGGSAVMADQYARLDHLTRLNHVTLLVLPDTSSLVWTSNFLLLNNGCLVETPTGYVQMPDHDAWERLWEDLIAASAPYRPISRSES